MLKLKVFSASWCGPCRALKPILKDLFESNPGLELTTRDVDEDYDEAISYNIRSLPTVIFEKDNQEIMRKVGLSSKEEYQKIIEDLKN